MAEDSDPNHNLLRMTAFQNAAGARSMRETDVNARQSRPTDTWTYLKQIILRYQSIPDGLVFITCCLVIPFLEYGIIPSNKIGFTCGDPLISHKYRDEIVTPEILGVLSVFLPLILLTSSEILKNRRTGTVNLWLVGFYMKQVLCGAALTLLVTEVAKSIIAEQRPNFFDVCQPDTAKECVKGTWVEDFKCTSTRFSEYFKFDASRSFPSGHSSLTAFIGVFCMYLVHTRFSAPQIGELTKTFLISTCLTYTLFCSLTRITDKRHHWWDVLTGNICGFLLALYYVFITHNKVRRMHALTEESNSNTERTNHIV